MSELQLDLNKLTALDQKLLERGYLEIAKIRGWEEYSYKDPDTKEPRIGWRYPVHNFFGQPVLNDKGRPIWRWKNSIKGEKPKNIWMGGKTGYYGGSGRLLEHIKSTHQLLMTTGEPDTNTLNACGFWNVLNVFGENSIPASILDDFALLDGLETIYYYMDDDPAGRRAAQTLHDILSERYEFIVVKSPDGYHDLNEHFQAIECDIEKFILGLPNYEQVEFSKSIERRPTSAPPMLDDEINPRVAEALERAAIIEGGKNMGGKIGILSPRRFGHRHDRAGEHCTYYIASSSAFEFAHNEWIGAKELAEHWGIDIEALGGLFKNSSIQAKSATKKKKTPSTFAREDIEFDPAEYDSWYTSDKRELLKVRDEIKGTRLPDSEPIEGLIEPIRKFGGFANYHWTRYIALLVGATGLGKTSMIQDILEKAQARGVSSCLWSPEWYPRAWGYRTLIRHADGFSFDALSEHHVFLYEKAQGVQKHKGKELSGSIQAASLEAIEKALKWRGTIFEIEKANLPIRQVLDLWRYMIPKERAAGADIKICVLDYLQSDLALDENYKYYEFVMQLFKQFCMELNVFGLVASQMRKDDDIALRAGQKASGNQALGVSMNQANLVITLAPDFDHKGEQLKTATIGVPKNSMGMPGEVQGVRTNFKYLSWGI